MKIDAKKLYTFLVKATLDGEIATATLKIENDTLKSCTKSIDTTIAINAELKGFVALAGSWPIKDTKLLIQSLKLFDGVVEIVQQDNKLSIFNKDRQIDITLADESFIENDLDRKLELKYDTKVRMNTGILVSALRNKSIVKASTTKLSCTNNLFQITSGSNSFDTITEKQQLVYPDFEVTFSVPLDSVVPQLDDTMEVGFKSDYPATFRIFNEDYDIQYVVAHIMDLEGK